jgi:hypothetical protein
VRTTDGDHLLVTGNAFCFFQFFLVVEIASCFSQAFLTYDWVFSLESVTFSKIY